MIVNTTFVVDRDIAEAWLTWLRMAYIAEATAYGGMTSPQLARIVAPEAAGEADSYALQMRTSDADRWLTSLQPDLLQRMAGQWGKRVLHFTTLMEEVDL